MKEQSVNVALVQEPYTVNNKLAGIPKSYKICTSDTGKIRSAITVNDKEADVLVIEQLSDADCVVLEIR
jgi:hypothetical protein